MELKKLSINLPKPLNERWAAAARKERRTKTAILQLAIEQYLEKGERQPKRISKEAR
jgi:predicted DNA-binding protein